MIMFLQMAPALSNRQSLSDRTLAQATCPATDQSGLGLETHALIGRRGSLTHPGGSAPVERAAGCDTHVFNARLRSSVSTTLLLRVRNFTFLTWHTTILEGRWAFLRPAANASVTSSTTVSIPEHVTKSNARCRVSSCYCIQYHLASRALHTYPPCVCRATVIGRSP